MTQNDHDKRTQIIRVGKALFLVLALILAYLFALNGRYIQEDDGFYFDKWTKSIVEIARYKTVE